MKPEIFCLINDFPLEDGIFRYMLSFAEPEKRERILRQRIKLNADSMLLGDMLAKFAVKKVFSVPVCRQKTTLGKYGKPYLAAYPDIHFSISHSDSLVICAVCDTPVGADVQKVCEYKPALAEHVCSGSELCEISGSVDKADTFCRLWAAKEAFVKMKGVGIGCDLKKINPKPDISLCIENYRICVCYEKG
ncbi:MAG: 4'-phosphopantetheinyl transferase superfamily protein [Clostridia bacterium]|nr:4'-phosphopantetheinyl transferase superfamily protein [Clostridia bacterium]